MKSFVCAMPRANRSRAIPESRCSKKVPRRTHIYLCKKTLRSLLLATFAARLDYFEATTCFRRAVSLRRHSERSEESRFSSFGFNFGCPLHLLLLKRLG